MIALPSLSSGTRSLVTLKSLHSPTAIYTPAQRKPCSTCVAVNMYQLAGPFSPRSWQRQQQPRRAATTPAAAVASAAAAAGTVAGPAGQSLLASLLHAWHMNPASVLLAAGAFILGVSLSVFLVAAIPGILAMRRTALAMEQLLHTVRVEVPDTASTLRLSGLELADCIEEVSMLSNDLTQGLRSSARAVVAAEQGVRQGVDLAGRAVTGYVVPKLKSAVPEARDAVQAALEERAQLDYTAAALQEATRATKATAQRLRMGLAALGLARRAASTVQQIRSVVPARRQAESSRGGAAGTYGQQSTAWEEA